MPINPPLDDPRDVYRVVVTSPTGVSFDLTSGAQGVTAEEDAFLEMVGDAEDYAVSSYGASGHFVSGVVIAPFSGSIPVRIQAIGDTGGGIAREVFAWRRAWSRHPHELTRVDISTPFGDVFSAWMRLGAVMPAPPEDPRGLSNWGFETNVICDKGLWFSAERAETGIVTVTNSGDSVIHPKIRWHGPGGKLTLPSGISFTLPPTGEPRTLDMDPMQSMSVRADDGTMDVELWERMLAQGWPESVPVGTSRTFQVPASAKLIWRTPVLDPWR